MRRVGPSFSMSFEEGSMGELTTRFQDFRGICLLTDDVLACGLPVTLSCRPGRMVGFAASLPTLQSSKAESSLTSF